MMAEPSNAIEVATLGKVAELIGGDPQEVLLVLRHWGRLIDSRHTTDKAKADEDENKKLIETVRRLQQRLAIEAKIYAGIEAEFGFEAPTCFDDADSSLQDVVDFLQEQLSAPRKGGPTPDGRRLICARVCLVLWHQHHGKMQPYSPILWEACELYWQACGNEATSTTQGSSNWTRYLLPARNGS
jgi:hypothetical protein